MGYHLWCGCGHVWPVRACVRAARRTIGHKRWAHMEKEKWEPYYPTRRCGRTAVRRTTRHERRASQCGSYPLRHKAFGVDSTCTSPGSTADAP